MVHGAVRRVEEHDLVQVVDVLHEVAQRELLVRVQTDDGRDPRQHLRVLDDGQGRLLARPRQNRVEHAEHLLEGVVELYLGEFVEIVELFYIVTAAKPRI